ncbi:hypothetical protein EV386_2527 [Xylanimonas ulmi]|uniref:Lipoprotein n=1 Tax=Xylanimonas ulmi TaxID=228973 RepID=A0A4Q7M2T6_9MICO|nr:hypothetical protein EV386_2527 [Xylanibacterium ulmi]
MRGRWTVGASALALAALLAAGCDGVSTSAGPESVEEVPQAETTQDDVALDAAACGAVSDIQTIVANADVALSEGRFTVQEQQGWYQLATRALHRIPTGGDGVVSQGVAALQEAVPEIAAGTQAETFDITTDDWNAALAEPCAAAGSELSISMFTGG